MSIDLANVNYITALYIGAYGRAPDSDGIDYWAKNLDNGGSRTDLATFFASSDEAHLMYPYLVDQDASGISTFLDTFYENVFNRAPDAEGKAYWAGRIADGEDIGSVMYHMLVGAAGNDILTLQHKIDVANAYENATELSGKFDMATSVEIISDVGSSTASFNAGLDAVREHAYPAGEIVEVPGDTVYVPVPGPTVYVPTPVEPDHILSFNDDGTIHITGTNNYAGVEPLFGDGNYVDGRVIMIDHTAGIEISLDGGYRTGNQLEHDSSYGDTDGADGHVDFEGNSGYQMNGIENASGDNVGRSALSFSYTINTGINNIEDANASFFLNVDIDPSATVDFREFKLVNAAPGVNYWVDTETGTPVISDDDGSNPNISQNSINWGFKFLSDYIDGVGPAGTGDIPAGDYAVELQVRDTAGVDIIGSVRADFHMTDLVQV